MVQCRHASFSPGVESIFNTYNRPWFSQEPLLYYSNVSDEQVKYASIINRDENRISVKEKIQLTQLKDIRDEPMGSNLTFFNCDFEHERVLVIYGKFLIPAAPA